MTLRSLSGKRIVVTGASSGIGRAFAERCLREGAQVWLLGRDERRLQEVANAAPSSHAEVVTIDLADTDAIGLFVRRFNSAHTSLHALMHSAALFSADSLEETTADQFDRLFDTNLRAAWLLTRGLLPALREARGDMVFVNSSVVLHGGVGRPVYTMTKVALRSLADNLRAELTGTGVRVLSLVLGRTATPLQERITIESGKLYDAEALLQPEDVAAVTLAALALAETAEVTEIALRPALPPES